MSAGAMRSGKRIRLRHPAVAAGAVAVVAVAVVLAGYLALTHRQRPPKVTNVPAPLSAQNLVASGKIGNASWQILVRPYPQQPGQLCWYGHGPAFDDPIAEYVNTSEQCGGLRSSQDPLQLDGFTQEQLTAEIGVVRAGVTSVMFRLDDGQQLKLTPVKRYGYWLVAFVIPPQVRIASATATMNTGQYATAIPVISSALPALWPWRWHDPHGQ